MSGLFPSWCKPHQRKKKTKNKLPIEHRKIAKNIYIDETLYNLWRKLVYGYNVRISNLAFRKIIYDALFDVLTNKYGKNHHKDFLAEYERFHQYLEEQHPHVYSEIEEWTAYRNSPQYVEFLNKTKQIEDFQVRAKIALNNAMAFIYAKYQQGIDIAEDIVAVERKLKLDIIPQIWSKKWVWIGASILFFEANSLYAQTIAKNQIQNIEWDKERQEAIKIQIIPWYEQAKNYVSDDFRIMAKVYENILVPIAGEIGSVMIAEALRRGTSQAFLHAARVLYHVAKFHPALRGISWGARVLDFLRAYNDHSILAWLGWQIKVEWTLDETIQLILQKGLKNLWQWVNGLTIDSGFEKDLQYTLQRAGIENIFSNVDAVFQTLRIIENVQKRGYMTDIEKTFLEVAYSHASEKLRQMIDRILNTYKVTIKLQQYMGKEKEIKYISIPKPPAFQDILKEYGFDIWKLEKAYENKKYLEAFYIMRHLISVGWKNMHKANTAQVIKACSDEETQKAIWKCLDTFFVSDQTYGETIVACPYGTGGLSCIWSKTPWIAIEVHGWNNIPQEQDMRAQVYIEPIHLSDNIETYPQFFRELFSFFFGIPDEMLIYVLEHYPDIIYITNEGQAYLPFFYYEPHKITQKTGMTCISFVKKYHIQKNFVLPGTQIPQGLYSIMMNERLLVAGPIITLSTYYERYMFLDGRNQQLQISLRLTGEWGYQGRSQEYFEIWKRKIFFFSKTYKPRYRLKGKRSKIICIPQS